MTESSISVTPCLPARLLKDQEGRAKREAKLSFAKKVKIIDQLMADGAPRIE